ncbi:hypothetical protein M5X11_19810 [Paenibacillus alginolyticus]|jgi:hypothetical protein|uniref:Uncharacterized protein n=1 Tax=Paenibacillus alginolyticus TaxID=59839 RepID=A0ABT4G591_9BACL|nr:hypothetical protein [Paenibacillus alginolyticus]MCY9667153.1 hypothetical protein [Paenibacillus alginolyticus]MCY9691343.1 hypothetical protein [Paenibacillus alginolyticus]MEC0146453.1 hypothetical protein [Paenibacillus alginolyticus]
MKKSVLCFCLAMVPSIATIFLLIEFFPYTGLGRVVSIPATLFVNATILLISLLITQKFKSRVYKSLIWIAAIPISVLVAIALHPQEYLPSVVTQLREMIFTHTTE